MRRYCCSFHRIRLACFFIVLAMCCSSGLSGIAEAGDAGNASKYSSRPIKIIVPAADQASLLRMKCFSYNDPSTPLTFLNPNKFFIIL